MDIISHILEVKLALGRLLAPSFPPIKPLDDLSRQEKSMDTYHIAFVSWANPYLPEGSGDFKEVHPRSVWFSRG